MVRPASSRTKAIYRIVAEMNAAVALDVEQGGDERRIGFSTVEMEQAGTASRRVGDRDGGVRRAEVETNGQIRHGICSLSCVDLLA